MDRQTVEQYRETWTDRLLNSTGRHGHTVEQYRETWTDRL